MTKWKLLHQVLFAIGVIAVGWFIFMGVKADRLARIGAGYKAKIGCSEIFLAKRKARDVLAHEFTGIDASMKQISVQVDSENHIIRAHGPFGLGGVKAVYRPGYGCTLVNAGRVAPLPEPAPAIDAEPWREAPPVSGQAIDRIDYAALDFALSNAFDENTATHRAVLVAVDGKIVDERYADGFDKETPFLSWSMGKSVTATLVGAAEMRGLIDVNDPAPVPEWSGDAQKARITWNDLLRMQSGLTFGEVYDQPRSDVNRMLFEKADAGGAIVQMPADHAPGEVWYYSSGTTNLIARTLGQVLAAQGIEIYAFAREAILDPIGAASVTLEPDASGGFIGSSFVYATARDWARLGQLYLQDGVWDGMRLLPEGWTDYVRSPTPASDGEYGAQFWLNFDGAEGRARLVPGLPEEMYYFAGHEGQYVFIIPDKRMVIVRTGMTRGRSSIEAVTPLVKEIYDAVGMPSGAPSTGG